VCVKIVFYVKFNFTNTSILDLLVVEEEEEEEVEEEEENQTNKRRHTFNVRRTTFSQKEVWAITCFHVHDTISCLVLTELICYTFNCREITTGSSTKLYVLSTTRIIKRKTV
jgi:hypothetical protein